MKLGQDSHLHILHMQPGEVHEDNTAIRLAEALAGEGVVHDPIPSEGKVTLAVYA